MRTFTNIGLKSVLSKSRNAIGVLIAFTLGFSTVTAPAFAATVGIGPVVNAAAYGESQVLVQWDSPATTLQNQAGEYVGPSGFEFKVTEVGSETEMFVSSSCESLTSESSDCVFIAPVDLQEFDIQVRAVYSVDGINQYSNWGINSFEFAANSDIENPLVEAIANDGAGITWTNASNAAKSAAKAKIYVDGKLVTTETATVVEAETYAPEWAEVSALTAGAHVITIELLSATDEVLATRELAYEHQTSVVAPIVQVVDYDESKTAAVLYWTMPTNSARISGWNISTETTSAYEPAGCVDINVNARTCIIGNLDPAAEYQFSVSAEYGIGVLGETTTVGLRAPGIYDVKIAPASADSATLNFEVGELVFQQSATTKILLNNEIVDCPDLAYANECVLTDVTKAESYIVEIQLLDENEKLVDTKTETFVFNGVPAAPTVTTTETDTPGTYGISWQAPANSSDITAWDVVVAGASGATFTSDCEGVLPLETTSCVITTDSEVMIEIRGVFAESEVTAAGRVFLNQSPIGHFKVLPASETDVVLQWGLSELADIATAEFVIRQNGEIISCQDSDLDFDCIVQNLQAGKTHTFEITLLDSEGEVVATETTSIYINGPPIAPVVSIDATGTTAVITWTYPENISAAGITGWDVLITTEFGEVLSGTCENAEFEKTDSECTVTGITSETEFEAAVTPIYGLGLFGQTGYAYYGVSTDIDFTSLTLSNTSALVEWELATLLENRITAVNVFVDEKEIVCESAIQFQNCVVENLVAGQSNLLRIEFLDENGNQIAAANGSFMVEVAPTAPAVVVSDNGETATIYWSYPAATPASVVGYEVTVIASDFSIVSGCDAAFYSAATSSCEIANLNPAVEYEVAVTAIYGDQLAGGTGYAYLHTSALSAIQIFAHSPAATISWQSSDLLNVADYEVRVNGIQLDCPDALIDNTCELPLAVVGANYEISISAFDANQNLISNLTSTQTLQAAPAAPQITFEVNAETGLVTWNSASDLISAYEVLITSESGAAISGSCAQVVFGTAGSCEITNLDPADSIAVEVRGIYGFDLFTDSAYAYYQLNAVQDFSAVTISATEVLASWNLSSLLDTRVEDIEVLLGGNPIVCDALDFNQCVVTQLEVGKATSLEIRLLQSGEVFETFTTEITLLASPSAPMVTIQPGAGTAEVNWESFTNIENLTGWWIEINSDSLNPVVDTCTLVELASATSSCEILNFDANAAYEVAVTPIYAEGVLGSTGYGYYNLEMFSQSTAVPTSPDSAVILWATHSLLDSRIDQIEVLLDGKPLACESALAFDECELSALTLKQTYEIEIRLIAANSELIGSRTFEYTHVEVPTAPSVEISEIVNGSATITWGYGTSEFDQLITSWVVSFNSTDLVVDTCSGEFDSNQTSCVVTGLESTSEIVVGVSAGYGFDLASPIGIDFSNFNAISDFAITTTASNALTAEWAVHPLLDGFVSDIAVLVDGEDQKCDSAMSFNECTVTGLAPNQSYAFEVRLLAESGAVLATDTKSAIAYSAPAAPQLQVSNNGSAALLVWNYADAIPAGLTGYEINVISEFGTEVFADCLDSAVAANINSCEITGLNPAEAYEISVTALYGEQLPGGTAYAYLNTAAISNIQLYSSAMNQATVTWENSPLVGDRIDRFAVTVDGVSLTCDAAVLDNSCDFDFAVVGLPYEITVSALDADGNVLGSLSSNLELAQAPAAPSVSVEVLGGIATVTWAGTQNSNAINGFEVFAQTRSGDALTGSCDAGVFDTAGSCELVGLDPTDGLVVEVRALYGIGLATDPTFAYYNLEAVQDITATTISPDEVHLSWNLDSLISDRVDEIQILVDSQKFSCPDALVFQDCIITGLTPGIATPVQIQLLSDSAVIASSEISVVLMASPQAPIAAVELVGDDATISWSFAESDSKKISGWQVLITSSAGDTVDSVCTTTELPVEQLDCVVENLDLTAGYEVSVFAVYGDGLISNPGTAYINLVAIPEAQVIPAGDTTAILQWNVDPLVDARVASVEVLVDGVAVDCPDATEFANCDLAGLEFGQTYGLLITLFDENQTPLASTQLQYVHIGSPAAPEVELIPVSDSELLINWGYSESAFANLVTGWVVILTTANGTEINDTCSGAYSVETANCVLSGVSSDAVIGVEVFATYGTDFTTDSAFAYRNLMPFESLTALTINEGQVEIAWALHELIDSRVVAVEVELDGKTQICEDSKLDACVISGLATDIAYAGNVVLLDAQGKRIFESAIEVVAYSAPTAPEIVVHDAGTETQISWGYAGKTPAAISSWLVEIQTLSGAEVVSTCDVELSLDSTSCVVVGLADSESAEVVVVPVYGAGLTGTPAYAYLNTTPIQNLQALPTTDQSALLTWDFAEILESRVASVEVLVNGFQQNCDSAMLANDCELLGLLPATSYSIELRAYDADGVLITTHTVQYLHELPRIAPSNFQVTADNLGNASLSWEYPEISNKLISGWDLVVISDTDSDLKAVEISCADETGLIPASARTCDVTGLDPNAAYFFELRTDLANENFGTSAYAAIATSIVEDFTASATSQTAALVEWSAGFGWDEVVAAYQIYRGEELLCEITESDVFSTECEVDSNTPGENFELTFRAFDGAGNLLATTTATGLQPVVPVATDFAVSIVDNLMSVSWNYDAKSTTAVITGWEVVAEDRYDVLSSGTCFTDLTAETRSCTVEVMDAALGNRLTITPIYDLEAAGADLVGYRGPTAVSKSVTIYPKFNTVETAVLNFTTIEGFSEYAVDVQDAGGLIDFATQSDSAGVYDILDITPGDELLAEVRVIENGVEAFEAGISQIYVAPDVPEAVTNLDLRQTGAANQIGAFWTDSITRGIEVSTYTVDFYEGDVLYKSIETTKNFALLNGTGYGKSYSVVVTANSFVGASESETDSAETLAPPTAPLLSNLKFVDGGTVQFDFVAGSTSATQAEVTGFSVVASPSADLNLPVISTSDTSFEVTGLRPGTSYLIALKAKSLAGDSLASNVFKFTTPAAPAGGNARLVGDKAQVTWVASKTVPTNYVLQYRVADGDWTALETTATTAEISGLQAAANYEFRVAARYVSDIYGDILTPWSAVFSLAIPDVPLEPVTSRAYLTAADGIWIGWTATAVAAGRASITGIEVETKVNGLTTSTTLAATARNLVLTGIAAGAEVTYRVRALSLFGSSSWSEPATAFYTPAVVSDYKAELAGPTSIRASWTKPEGVVTGYTIIATPDLGAEIKISAPADATSALLTALTQGRTYSVEVIANFGAFSAGPTAAESVYISDVPNAPVLQSVELAGSNSLKVNFTPSQLDALRTNPNGYEISISPAAGVVLPAISADAESAIVTGLTEGLNYTVQIRAKSVSGPSAWSESAAIVSASKPTAVRVGVSARDLNVSWTAAKGEVTGYHVVALATDASGHKVEAEVGAAELTATLSTLNIATSYAVMVFAKYAGDVISNPSVVVNAAIANVPNAPTGLKGALASADSFQLGWNGSVSATGRAAVTGYEIDLSPNANVVIPANLGSALRTALLSNLPAGETFETRVRALSANGPSAWSDVFTFYTPITVTGVTAKLSGQSAIQINWDEMAGATSYTLIAVDPTERVIKTSVLAGETQGLISGLTAATTYRVSVVAAWGRISAAASAEISLTTDAPPAAPVLNTIAYAGTSEMLLSWTAPEVQAGTAAITGYVITGSPATGVVFPTIAADATSAVVSGLTAGSLYTFKVQAVSDAGKSPASNDLTLVAPAAPLSVTAKTNGPAATITWRAPRGEVTGYEITITDSVSSESTSITTDAATLTADFAALTTARTYLVGVVALYGEVKSPIATSSFTTNDVPLAPAVPTVTIAAADSVKISWSTPVVTAGRQAPSGFEIVATPSAGLSIPTELIATSRNAIVSGLTPGVEYSFQVRAISSVGAGELSAPAATYYAPGFVTDLKAEIGLLPVATVGWSKPAGEVTGYKVTATPTSGTGTVLNLTVVGGDVLTAELPRIAYNTEYAITVSAIYSRYTAGPSESVLLTGPAAPVLPAAFSAPSVTMKASSMLVSYEPLVPTAPVEVVGYYFTVNGSTVAGCGTDAEPIATPSCELSGLVLDTAYSIAVKAVLKNYRATLFTFASRATSVTFTAVAAATVSKPVITTTLKMIVTTAGITRVRKLKNVKIKRVNAKLTKVIRKL